jgi:hypothetical protein
MYPVCIGGIYPVCIMYDGDTEELHLIPEV